MFNITILIIFILVICLKGEVNYIFLNVLRDFLRIKKSFCDKFFQIIERIYLHLIVFNNNANALYLFSLNFN